MSQQAWTREQTLIALNLYCQLSFGQLHSRNPIISKTAELMNRSPSSLAMKLVNLASLDPVITQSGRKGLSSCSKLDREIWQNFMQHPELIGEESQLLVDNLVQSTSSLVSLSSVDNANQANFTGHDKVRSVKTRIKQSFFRKAVLSSYEGKCCMSGINTPTLLIASHIMPWSHNTQQRLNPRNGLCLSALHDKAYDAGLITVTPDFMIHVSKQLKYQEHSSLGQDYLLALEGLSINLPKKFQPEPEFLAYHQANIFLNT